MTPQSRARVQVTHGSWLRELFLDFTREVEMFRLFLKAIRRPLNNMCMRKDKKLCNVSIEAFLDGKHKNYISHDSVCYNKLRVKGRLK